MEGVIMDYHLWFMTLAIILLILELMVLFFSDLTIEKLFFCVIINGLNLNITWIAMFSFLSINIFGFDTAGSLVNNPTAEMWVFFGVFFGLFLVNVGLIIYTHIAMMRLKIAEANKPKPQKAMVKY